MAFVETTVQGFEGIPYNGYTDLGHTAVVVDGTAFEGLKYLKVVTTTPVSTAGVTIPTLLLAPASGQPFYQRLRVYIRPRVYPSVAGCWIASFDTTTGLVMDTAGHVAVQGAWGVSAYSTKALALNKWYRLDLVRDGVYQLTGKDDSARYRVQATISNLDTTVLASVRSPTQLQVPIAVGTSISATAITKLCQAGFQNDTMIFALAASTAFLTLGFTINVSGTGHGEFSGSYVPFSELTCRRSACTLFQFPPSGTGTWAESGPTLALIDAGDCRIITTLVFSTTVLLGATAAGPACLREIDYDGLGWGGSDFGPPAPPALGEACPAFQPAPASDSIVPMPVPVF